MSYANGRDLAKTPVTNRVLTNSIALNVALVDENGNLLAYRIPQTPVTINATASGSTEVVAAPASGISIVVRRLSVHNRDTTNRLVALRDGATNRWRAEIANEGGGAVLDFGDYGWVLTAATALNVNLDDVGSVDVNVLDYYLLSSA